MEGASAGFCDAWSKNFKGQCYNGYHCDNVCTNEGYIFGGECLWEGIFAGMACMCVYSC